MFRNKQNINIKIYLLIKLNKKCLEIYFDKLKGEISRK